MKRRPFIQRLIAFFASLSFWKTPAAPEVLPTPEEAFREFDKDGLQCIMWAIDREFGQEKGPDPWIEEQKQYYEVTAKAPKTVWKDCPQWPRLQLMQKDAHKPDRTEITSRWGVEGESPEFTGKTPKESYLKAVEWAKTIPNSRISNYFLLIIEPCK